MLDGNGWLDVKEKVKQGQQAGVRCSGSSRSYGRSDECATCIASFIARSDHEHDDNI
jgi:hypothetical protein